MKAPIKSGAATRRVISAGWFHGITLSPRVSAKRGTAMHATRNIPPVKSSWEGVG